MEYLKLGSLGLVREIAEVFVQYNVSGNGKNNDHNLSLQNHVHMVNFSQI